MPVCQEETLERLARIPNVALTQGVALSCYTRFTIGGPAEIYLQTADEASFMEAIRIARGSGRPFVVIGGGTNLIVSDAGFQGIVLRFTADGIRHANTSVHAAAGAELQALVDFTVTKGLQGLETMTGIPGTVGGAVYGNAGAYGHSIMERISSVRFFDGERVRCLSNPECEFHYRESIFKRHKDWIIFSTELSLDPAPAGDLQRTAGGIRKIRDEKYPPSMKCAGSIFKNLILAELPESVRQVVPAKVIREGKIPSAWFLEQAGAKGMHNGDIRVADYHANLIYNAGHGTARELKALIDLLKSRVRGLFGFDLEEEVQYLGFEADGARAA